MPLRPIISSSASYGVCEGLPSFENVLELTSQNLLIDNSALHVDNDGPCLQIINLGSSLQIHLTILSAIYISEETTQCLVVNHVLVIV